MSERPAASLAEAEGPSILARRFRVTGIVQGVGFRPFIYRLAAIHHLAGWVRNDGHGVEIHVEGRGTDLTSFEAAIVRDAPVAAVITSISGTAVSADGLPAFEIRSSPPGRDPTTEVSPDLAVCEDCRRELGDDSDRRAAYPYINCTNCGPRYSIVLDLPYDRPRTTMAGWAMCDACRREYEDSADRRFHAQPVACPACGPRYSLLVDGVVVESHHPIEAAARMLRDGRIVAIKGTGGFHLACDARNESAVMALRERKYRKERPFALMVPDVELLRTLVDASSAAIERALSNARPIVLAAKRVDFSGVAPDNTDLGVMLPYTPLHHLLFAAGAPDVLVMTSGNRSSEPIAYRDDEARERLAGIAEAILMGERPIARRVEDSVVQDGPLGPVVIRRSRGYAPAAVTTLPAFAPILALGADLKNAITLVVDGHAFVSQHIGDLDDHASRVSFDETVNDLLRMYQVDRETMLVVHDAHPEYYSTRTAGQLGVQRVSVQHHRAHIASVLAERRAWSPRVIGVAFDGTGFGDDGSIWGGEFFAGSLHDGFERVAHLRAAVLLGGDAAARLPAQAAAGFLADLDRLPDLTKPPFNFPAQYRRALTVLASGVRTFVTTSAGRLFDTVAALAGFVRPITFEGQAAIWLEHLARQSRSSHAFDMPVAGVEIDYRPALIEAIESRLRGVPSADIACAFHRGLAAAAATMARRLALHEKAEAVVLSGGVFQNRLLVEDVVRMLIEVGLPVWTNHEVPPNDGGISLGQAALAAFASRRDPSKPDAR
jgi:hydrogenase maturation protein HypF